MVCEAGAGNISQTRAGRERIQNFNPHRTLVPISLPKCIADAKWGIHSWIAGGEGSLIFQTGPSASSPNTVLGTSRDNQCAMVLTAFANFMEITVQLLTLDKQFTSCTVWFSLRNNGYHGETLPWGRCLCSSLLKLSLLVQILMVRIKVLGHRLLTRFSCRTFLDI